MRSLLLLFTFVVLANGQSERKPLTTDQLGIEVRDPSRAVIVTNKGGSYFYTEPNAEFQPARCGWYVDGIKMMDDYTIMVDQRPLKRTDIVRTTIYPHQFIREYRNGTKERVTLIDHSNALLIELDSVKGKEIAVRPYFKDVRDTSEIVMRVQYGELYIGKKNRDVLSTSEFPSMWLGLLLAPGTTYSFVFYEAVTNSHGYSPASMHSTVLAGQYLVEFFASDNPRKLVDLGVNTMKNFTDSIYDRRVRIDQMMNKSYLRTDDEDLSRAISWAKVSLDALSIDDPSKGIWSGLPFGNRFEARDAFTSTTGALLGIGNFTGTKSMLRSFAATQDTNTASRSYGSISDVLLNPPQYNNADATPLFIASLDTYLQYSGDSAFASEMFPFVKRSINGALRYRTDSLVFLTHGDNATWMNIPRGNRANEIQALWLKQLEQGIEIADYLHRDTDQKDIGRWKNAAAALKENFKKYFIDSVKNVIADHLPAKGSVKTSPQPNQIYDIDLADDNYLYRKIFTEMTSWLVSPLGVSTKAITTTDVHPFRYAQQYYPPEHGLSEGVIYPWLCGEWIKQAAQFGIPETAMVVTQNLSGIILSGPVSGSLPDILDAVPAAGDSVPRMSGYESSARSLAEYLRSWYEGYLGVKVDRMGSRLTLQPNLPTKINDVDFNIPIGASVVGVHYKKSGDQLVVDLTTPVHSRPIDVVLISPLNSVVPPTSGREVSHQQAEITLMGGAPVSLVINKGEIRQAGSGPNERIQTVNISSRTDPGRVNDIRLAPTLKMFDMTSLAKPSFPLLRIDDLKRPVGSSRVYYDTSDSLNRDNTMEHRAYPALTGLKSGSLDVTRFIVRGDSENVYFTIAYRDLCYPLEHPERGFERTITAIAIDKKMSTSSQQAVIGRNAEYSLAKFSLSDIIYLGNGLRVEDAGGKILAEYFPVPSDERSPLADFNTRTITFSLPAGILGVPGNAWRYAVVTGIRDDSGGDVGIFRSLKDIPTTGKERLFHKSTGNVVDILMPGSGKR